MTNMKAKWTGDTPLWNFSTNDGKILGRVKMTVDPRKPYVAINSQKGEFILAPYKTLSAAKRSVESSVLPWTHR